MNWCKHMNLYKNVLTMPPQFGGEDFRYCPVCGTPKPARKGLEEKFLTAIAEHRAFGMGGCTIEDKCQRQKLAQAAIDHACEVINSMPIVNPVIVDQIKQALRESI